MLKLMRYISNEPCLISFQRALLSFALTNVLLFLCQHNLILRYRKKSLQISEQCSKFAQYHGLKPNKIHEFYLN